jgi:hypothetical protein
MNQSPMTSAVPEEEPVVRGVPAVELAIIMRVPACPLCGQQHRFPYLSWGGGGGHLWRLTCPLVSPAQTCIVHAQASSLAAAERRAEGALQLLTQEAAVLHGQRVERTWVLGFTWAPTTMLTEESKALSTLQRTPVGSPNTCAELECATEAGKDESEEQLGSAHRQD